MKYFFITILLCQHVLLNAQNNRFDVVITEIMSDPTPAVGLPAYEYIELRNRTTITINLQNWKIGDASGTANINIAYNLKPDSSVTICGTTAGPFFAALGPTIAVTSFPSLDNDGEFIFIRNNVGKNIHAVQYNANWHANPIKKDGGWSLEMKDISKPCVGVNNWTSSTDVKGGTPSLTNSVNTNNIADEVLNLEKAIALNSTDVLLYFSTPIDSIAAANIANYTINGVTITQAIPQAPLFNTVLVKVNSLTAGQIYTVTLTGITNCSNGNININSAKTGLTTLAAANDVIINEILFDPKTNGYDFVELYNKSNKLINIKELFIANRSGTAIANQKLVSVDDAILFPNEYLVVTEDKLGLQQLYTVENPLAISEIATLPTYSDDKGTCVIVNSQGTIIDELAYVDDWHFPLLSNKKGISLERISFTATTQDANNWFSAAFDNLDNLSGATPTYKNSQFKNVVGDQAITLQAKLFSPDGDGVDDVCIIQYNVAEPGMLCNVYIHDASGRQIKHLVKSALLSQQGQFLWNGTGELNQKIALGNYIIVTEITNLKGKKKQYKHVVALVRKL
jgi:hypothetical protein